MNDIATELTKLHELTGAEFSRQVERIALRREFRLVDGEMDIYTVGGDQDADRKNLMNAAHKAVEHGYRVFILPNPKGVRTADFILQKKKVYRVYDLKTIQGKASVSNRLQESIGQTARVLLNMNTTYDARQLAVDIKHYFESSDKVMEILIFKGGKMISVDRLFVKSQLFVKLFRKRYEK